MRGAWSNLDGRSVRDLGGRRSYSDGGPDRPLDCVGGDDLAPEIFVVGSPRKGGLRGGFGPLPGYRDLCGSVILPATAGPMPRKTTTLGPCSHSCDAEPSNDPATVKGFLVLLAIWGFHAVTCLLRLKIPKWPNFWKQTYFLPIRTGGVDHRYGQVRGGPQVFGGQNHDGYECAWGPSLIERTYTVTRNGRRQTRGWVLRRPESYSQGKTRFTTSATMEAWKEIAS